MRRTTRQAGTCVCDAGSFPAESAGVGRGRPVVRGAFTLIELMVVVVIVVMLVALSFPALSAMRAGSGRSAAMQTINAALMAARSYAIMNRTLTAARFQPNGKIFLVYKVPEKGLQMAAYGNALAANLSLNRYPRAETSDGAGNGIPNDKGVLYLPVAGREALQLPANVIAIDATDKNSTDTGIQSWYQEPFYVCYRPDGSLANGELVWVGLTDDDGEPVNIRMISPDGSAGGKAWTEETTAPTPFPSLGGYTYAEWAEYIKDPMNVGDVDVNAVYRFSHVSGIDGDTPDIQRMKINDPDHYAGYYIPYDGAPASAEYEGTPAISRITLVPAPEQWNDLPIVAGSSDKSKTSVVNEICAEMLTTSGKTSDRYEQLYINAYTGRLIPQN